MGMYCLAAAALLAAISVNAAKGPPKMQLPNIWGDGGALFAFSGMDGETDWRHPLVGSTLASGRGFVFHTEAKPVLRFGIRLGDQDYVGDKESPFSSVVDDVVGGGIVISHLRAGGAAVRLECLFADKDTIAARVTAEDESSPAEVFIESVVNGRQSSVLGEVLIQDAEPDYYALGSMDESASLNASEGRAYAALAKPGQSAAFAWSYSPEDPKDAAARVSRALNADFDAMVRAQIGFFRGLPAPKTSNEDLARAYYKCASVLKVNCWSPQDRIPFGWTTPDRWPHRHMWIWDSAFHAIGLRHISDKWAEDAIKAVLALQRANGFIPHTLTPDGSGDSTLIQPPILAWAGWKVYEKTDNLRFLDYIYPRISEMIRYDCDANDSDDNGLSEWYDRNASGMDNSPRFDQPIMDAVDLNCYIVNDIRYLARMAQKLGKDEEAREWEKLADERADLINALLWDEETGFYYDSAPDGSLVKIKTESGFTPLLARVCDKRRADRLVKHLTDPDEFWRAFPISSVAADEPTFSDNMWRGPVWVNFNYFLIDSLPFYGYADVAGELRRRTLEEVARWQKADGLIYEFYDSEASTDPVFLHRKALGGPGAKKAAASLGTTVCDYNFTAALYLDLLQSR